MLGTFNGSPFNAIAFNAALVVASGPTVLPDPSQATSRPKSGRAYAPLGTTERKAGTPDPLQATTRIKGS